MAKKSHAGASEVAATSVIANAGENLTSTTKTSERPRPAEVILTEPVKLEALDGTKWADRYDEPTKVVDCKGIEDDELIGFKVGPYVYDIPQHSVKLRFVEVAREVGTDGQRFRGSKTLYKVVATFADGRVSTTTDTTDKIRRLCGIGVDGTAKTVAEQIYLWFNGKGAELNARLTNAEFNAKFAELAKLAEDLVTAERKKREDDRAKASAEAKAQKARERADKHADDMTNDALIKQVAKRRNISYAEAKKMLGL
jgi:hypothetical protein